MWKNTNKRTLNIGSTLIEYLIVLMMCLALIFLLLPVFVMVKQTNSIKSQKYAVPKDYVNPGERALNYKVDLLLEKMERLEKGELNVVPVY